MNVLIIKGSPHEKGTTSLLAKKFEEGARAAGHVVQEIDAAHMDIKSCLGCNYCRKNNGICVHNDDMADAYPMLSDADAIVFVTPLYYFGFTSQIKKVIDRFYAMNFELRAEAKMACLLAAGADREEWAMEGISATFDVMCRYLRWENAGSVLALGCGSREEIKESEYLGQAEVLGRSV